MKQIILFKGFSTCSNCADRFRTIRSSEDPENVTQHEIKILFRIGNNPEGLHNLKKFIEEFDQPRMMPRCCLLADILANGLRFVRLYRLDNVCEPECGSNISHTPIPSEINDEPFPIGRAEGPQGYDFSSNPSPNEREFVSGTRTNTDDSKDWGKNVAHGGGSVSQCPMQLEMQLKDKDIYVEQTVVNSTPTGSNSAATIAIKPRKSNRSRKANKRRRIKNSF